jgi:hypothetical protein
MKKTLLLMLLVTFCAAYSAENSFYFLRYVGSARSAGLGGAFVSMTDDPSALFFNPASVATNRTKNFSFTFFKHVLDVNSGTVTFNHKWENVGNFAGSVVFTNYGSFEGSDKLGQSKGTFTANDIAVGVSYANKLDTNLYYGGTLKLISSSIEKYSSFAFALDFGLLFELPEKRTNIGVSILNVGTQLSTFSGVRESLPLDIRIGINHRLRGLPLLLNFSFVHLADATNNFFDKFLKFTIGGEFEIGQYVNLRLGYDNNIRKYSSSSKDKGFSGFNGGVGIKVKEILNFDYGISQIGSSAIFHRFSIYYDI